MSEPVENGSGFLEPHVEQAWLVEIERRMAALDAGETKTVSWVDFRSEVESVIFGR